MDQIRQGDVLLMERGSVVGVEVEPQEGSKVILAYGEMTGHHHRFENLDGGVKMFRHDDGSTFVSLRGRSEIVHEEHGAIAIAGGIYEQAFQVEYTPAEIRRVAD